MRSDEIDVEKENARVRAIRSDQGGDQRGEERRGEERRGEKGR